jgi:hypothetical protein
MRRGIWAECASTSMFYGIILLNPDSTKSAHESMFGVKFKKLRNLIRFVEMVMVTAKKNIQEKISDSGMVCMFLGCPKNHSYDFYRLSNVKTRQVVKSRD